MLTVYRKMCVFFLRPTPRWVLQQFVNAVKGMLSAVRRFRSDCRHRRQPSVSRTESCVCLNGLTLPRPRLHIVLTATTRRFLLTRSFRSFGPSHALGRQLLIRFAGPE